MKTLWKNYLIRCITWNYLFKFIPRRIIRKKTQVIVISLSLKQLFNKFREDNQNTTKQNVKSVNNLSTMANAIEEKKVNVDGFNINYVKTGKGEHAILLIPGLLGSIWTDFKPQIENLNKEKLTIIAWDQPGYGKSRPPVRTFPKNYHEQDATWGRNLMKTLGYDRFSVMGWSDGGITAIVCAAMYPENVRKMIVINTYAYLSPTVMENFEVMGDINTWCKRDLKATLDLYGEKYSKDVLTNFVDLKRHAFKHTDGDVCQEYLKKIKCPSLIVYGKQDVIIPREQADCMQANIVNSKIVTFEDGEHGVHLEFPDEFNALAHEFLID